MLEAQLKKSGKYILEQGYSSVDMHFYPWVASHGYAKLSIDQYPNIGKWLATVGDGQDVKDAYKRIPEGKHA